MSVDCDILTRVFIQRNLEIFLCMAGILVLLRHLVHGDFEVAIDSHTAVTLHNGHDGCCPVFEHDRLYHTQGLYTL